MAIVRAVLTRLRRRHVVPGLGGVAGGKLAPQMVPTWRADLLANGVSVWKNDGGTAVPV
ncbi:hypothetical protein AB0J63_17465 [Streptosporangium canum]|uniref:hypothetical protein n=1 Tax=Streptosporangium canum TaxID=324952 RepID=UPI003428F9DD